MSFASYQRAADSHRHITHGAEAQLEVQDQRIVERLLAAPRRKLVGYSL